MLLLRWRQFQNVGSSGQWEASHEEGHLSALSFLLGYFVNVARLNCDGHTLPGKLREPFYGALVNIVDHNAKDGFLAMIDASWALKAGRIEEGIELLKPLATVSTNGAIATHDTRFMLAVVDARYVVFALKGCPASG